MILAAFLSATVLPPCDFDAAEPVSIYEAAAGPERWIDRCVRIDGFAIGDSFYADVAGVYRSVASNARDRLNQGWLGLYLAEDEQFADELRRATIVGRLDDCERMYEEGATATEEGGLFMLMGYCRYTEGLVLRTARARYGPPAELTRQTGAANRSSFGDLSPESATSGAPPEAERMVAEFLRGLRAGDTLAVRQLVRPYFATEPEIHRSDYNGFVMGEGGSPFREVRQAGGDVQTTYFREILTIDLANRGFSPDWFACFCREPDCADQWPISHIDATAALDRPERPYVCLRYHRPPRHHVGGQEVGYFLGTERFGIDLIESSNVEPTQPE